jgi:hypothetical protein
VSSISRSDSQGFKTTGVKAVPLAPAIGQVVYTNSCTHNNPTFTMPKGQRLYDPTNQLDFAQTSGDANIAAGKSVTVNIIAVRSGSAGNVGGHVITQIVPNAFSCLSVDNPQATGGGTDPSSTPQMTVTDFDAARAQMEQQLHQAIAQQLAAGVQKGEKLSESIVYGAPQFNTDHSPNDAVQSFSGTMTVTGEGDYYFDGDVTKAFQNYLAQRVPNDQELLTESGTQVSYRLLSASAGGNLTFVGTVTAYVAAKLDEAKVRSQIVGRQVTSAKIYLQSLGVKSVVIKESPIPLPLMPVLSNHIAIHYVVESGTALPSANPSVFEPSPSPSASP